MSPEAEMGLVTNGVALVCRLLLAWIFLHEGVFLVLNFDAAAVGMAKAGVPAPLLIASTALQIVAGLAIALGWFTRAGAAALGVFCLIAATMFHTNFVVRNELLHFEKDFAMAGGMFLLMLHGAGRWSIDGLARRAA